MSSEVSTVADDHSVEALRRELAEAREQQAATGEILRIISTFQKDSQPVLDAIVTASKRLLRAHSALVTLVAGDELQFAACTSMSRAADEELRRFFPLKLDGVGPTVAAVRERTPFVTTDTETDARLDAAAREVARRRGYRSILIVPLLRSGTVIGTINIARSTSGTFTEADVAILKNFADQAVIAIENTRLFEAEQASKRELTQALEYQTATSDVLGVIAASPTNIRPVLQTLVDSACRLCAAYDGIILLREGDWLQVRAHHGPIPVNVEKRKITRDWVNGRCVADGVQIHVEDLQAEVAEYPEGAALAQRLGARTILTTPLMREGEAIGAIMIRRDEVRPFSDKQIGLIETFARQAVIAIENTRLFEQVQARTRELTEALDQQTATADVLKAISRSAFDVQKVLDTLIEAAVKLTGAKTGILRSREGDVYPLVASFGLKPEWHELIGQLANAPGHDTLVGRVTLEGRTVQIPDVFADPDFSNVEAARIIGFRANIGTPLHRDGQIIGYMAFQKETVGPFGTRQVELIETFANQAVIAIENTRLFEAEQARTRDLTVALEQQTATADVLKVISRSTFDLQTVLDTIVATATRLCGAEKATIRRRSGDAYQMVAEHGCSPEQRAYMEKNPVAAGPGTVVGRAGETRKPVYVADVEADPGFRQMDLAMGAGFRAALGVPLLREGEIIGVLMLLHSRPDPFTADHIERAQTFADQAVIAIENARLFDQVQTRTRELAKTVEDLEIASQHKNQFVANMSHELRTPLAAILGYAELIQEGFYEPQGPKSLDALARIRSNGKHLLGLINTVLDIAKIESGQFTLNMAEYAIESVVETVRSATESLAQNKKLALKTEVAKSLPVGLGATDCPVETSCQRGCRALPPAPVAGIARPPGADAGDVPRVAEVALVRRLCRASELGWRPCWLVCSGEPRSSAGNGGYTDRGEITSGSTCTCGGIPGPCVPLLQGDIIGLSGGASVLDGSHRATRGPRSQRFNPSDPPNPRGSGRGLL